MAGIKRILAFGTHQPAAITWSELLPQQPHPPRMGLAGNQDYRALLLLGQSRADRSDFIRGVDNRGLQHMNGLPRNSLVEQNPGAVNFFAFVSDAHGLQRLSWLGRLRKPYLPRVALAIELRRFAGAHRHSSAEHNNGPYSCQGVFHYQPSTDAEERDKSQSREAASYGSNNDGAALAGRDHNGRVWRTVHSRETSACYPALTRWSNCQGSG